MLIASSSLAKVSASVPEPAFNVASILISSPVSLASLLPLTRSAEEDIWILDDVVFCSN
jgi:hypothetical protein